MSKKTWGTLMGIILGTHSALKRYGIPLINTPHNKEENLFNKIKSYSISFREGNIEEHIEYNKEEIVFGDWAKEEICQEYYFNGTDMFIGADVKKSEYSNRKCFNFKCAREITFEEFKIRNYDYGDSNNDLKWLEKIWESPYIQLYCCRCYRKKEYFAKKEERLLKKAKRICRKFGFELEWSRYHPEGG